jgi:hypothetical protein
MSKNCETTKGPRGQTIARSFGRDDSSFSSGISDDQSKNGKAGGSATNLGHSLSGAAAVQHVSGEK